MTTKTITNTAITAKPTVTYAAAYATLASIAERLKGPGTAASLDTLASDVYEARRCYQEARDRLDAIRIEIDAELASNSGSAKA